MKREIITDLEKLKEAAQPVNIQPATEEEKETLAAQRQDLIDTLQDSPCLALSAPQIGINARIIAIKFSDTIKLFINPIVTKKINYAIGGETCASMPNKEILLARPEEVQLVYYTNELKYEDNKLLGAAARIFDQQNQLLDGVTPDELGLVSDITEDGSLSDLSEEEYKQVTEIYKQYIAAKTKNATEAVKTDEELAQKLREMKFAEDVISGRTLIIENEEQRRAINRTKARTQMMINKSIADDAKLYRKQQLDKFLKCKGK